jgi:hypothetical protein
MAVVAGASRTVRIARTNLLSRDRPQFHKKSPDLTEPIENWIARYSSGSTSFKSFQIELCIIWSMATYDSNRGVAMERSNQNWVVFATR